MTRQERVKKLHQDLRIDENEMLRDKPVLRKKLKDLVDKYEDVFVTVDRTVGMVPDQYKTHIRLKPGAKPKKQKSIQQHGGGGNSNTAVRGAGGRWKKQLTR